MAAIASSAGEIMRSDVIVLHEATEILDAMPGGTVGEYMSSDIATVEPDDDLFRLTYVFTEHPVRRVVVVDADDTVLGVISRHDLLSGLDAACLSDSVPDTRPPTR